MKTTLIQANSRGQTKIDWLDSFHTFSFGDYHDPERNHFGLLRVLNDDTVKPSKGFDPHSHQNMEIITIPLSGSLFHQDHLGNRSTIQKGEVQIMSAGTGIMHSEHNPSSTDDVSFFQIWIYPKEKQIMPRYGQKLFAEDQRQNQLQCVVSPDERTGSLWINQSAYVYLSKLTSGKNIEFEPNVAGQGVLLMSIHGELNVNGQKLNPRDAVTITDIEKISIQALRDSEFVLFEVPMN